MIVQTILNFLGGSLVAGLLDAYKSKLAADGSIDKSRTDLAMKELELQTREADLRSQERLALHGRPWEPLNLMGYATAFYFAKVLVWDAALHLGSTDAVGGAVGEWAGMYMAFYLGKRGIENVTKILRR
jgi:hypothetical protein